VVTDEKYTNHPSEGDVKVVEDVIARLNILIAAAHLNINMMPRLLKNNSPAEIEIEGSMVKVPVCAGCAAYKKDCSEAPYTMYHAATHPEYYLDCLHCPICFILGDCNSDGSKWAEAYGLALKGKKDAFIEVAKAAIKKLKAAVARWS
jgi:hypothetical protein